MNHEKLTEPPAWRALPPGRVFSEPFWELRERIYVWLDDYYDRDHLIRAGDWMLALAPWAPEPLVLAALTHDLERSVPGGPVLDFATVPWDDEAYNHAHCARSAVIVTDWLREHGAPEEMAKAVDQPIREHEFGGSAEGDLMQAADSISFLETNAELIAGWVLDSRCSPEKGIEKLRWMCERVRHRRGRKLARRQFEICTAQVERRLADGRRDPAGEQRRALPSPQPDTTFANGSRPGTAQNRPVLPRFNPQSGLRGSVRETEA